jgi:dephospho-CoA kinase
MNQGVLRIGVAGYMGSGKTTCAAHLARDRGVIIDADAEAKQLMASDESIRRGLARDFGPDIILDDSVCFGTLGRKAFRSPESIRRLNAIVHPPLLRRLRAALDDSSAAVTVLDAALIPFWAIDAWFDRLLWIDASAGERFRRLRARLSLDPDTIRRRMRVQEAMFAPPDSAKWTVVRNESAKEDFHRATDAAIAAGDQFREQQQ